MITIIAFIVGLAIGATFPEQIKGVYTKVRDWFKSVTAKDD